MDKGLKQRLVGAIVLVAIAVLFLPSLFNRDGRQTVDLTSQVPPEPATVIEMLDVAEPQQPDNIPAAKPLEENYTDPVPTTAAEAANDPQASKPEKPALNAQGIPEAWSLQVASFQSGDRAQVMLKRLQEAGYQSYVAKATTTEGPVHRVFVGPKINKAAAEAEKRSIDRRFNTNALLVEFKP